MRKILAIAAHPDDLEFSCTGTFIKRKKQGDELYYLIVTNGESGFKENPMPPPEKRIQIRKKEQINVCNKLGVKETIFLNYRDGFLKYTEQLRAQIVELIKRIKPDDVFSFDPANREFNDLNLFHRDHRVVALAVFDACFAAKNHLMYEGEQHLVDKIYFFGSDKPDNFEDITDLIDQKLQLLAMHKSQFPDFSKIENFIKNEVSAKSKDYKYSEAFRVIKVRQIS